MTTRPAPDFLRIPLLIALACGLALLLLFLLVQPLVSLVIALILLAVVVVARRAGVDVMTLPRAFLRTMLAYDTVTHHPLPRWQTALEITAVFIMVALSTHRFYTAGEGIQLSGNEVEWLTSSVYAAHDGLRTYGRIPLWQPYLEFGEPLLENPFSFLLNPFSSLPGLILGGEQGAKLSVVITTALAGLGGWFLGRVLGFGLLGRVLLGMLLVGKGNMSAMFNTGYYQLAAAQAYFPWIIAGVLSLFYYPQRRWPPVLLAVSGSLLLFVGNVWYTLPMFVCVAVIAAVYLLHLPPSDSVVSPSLRSGEGVRGRGLSFTHPASLMTRYVPSLSTLWSPVLRRCLVAGLLTFAISAVFFIPVWTHRDQIGNHPPEIEAGWIVPLWRSAAQFYFNPDPRQMYFRVMDPLSLADMGYYMDRLEEIYFSFAVPPWLVLLLFVLIPIYRPRGRRIWLAAWVLLAFFTLWGAGGQPLFIFLYRHIPFLQGWRFVGRALAVGSFWLAVLVAMRADSLWHIFLNLKLPKIFHKSTVNTASLIPKLSPQSSFFRPLLSLSTQHSVLSTLLRPILAAALAFACLAAAWEVNKTWNTGIDNILNPINPNAYCLNWLRFHNPDANLVVWQYGYSGITAYLNNHIRIFDVLADFEMSPMPNTLGHIDLTRSLPEYGIGWTRRDRQFLLSNGYRPIGGPRVPMATDDQHPCLYRKSDVLSYAYTVSIPTLDALKPPLLGVYTEIAPDDLALAPDQTTPVTTYSRQPDNITLLVDGDPSGKLVLTLQERAFPGWEVHLDGVPAKLESVGGQLGVVLPADDQPHVVYFVYRPPLFFLGAAITLFAAAFSILYLLRIDRFFRKKS